MADLVMPWGPIKPPVGSQVDWGDPINYRLVVSLLCNESAGSIVYNGTRNNYVTLTSGPTWRPGKFGTAVNYGGSSERSVGSTDSIPFSSNSVTISLWCKYSAKDAFGILICKSNDTNNTNFWDWGLEWGSTAGQTKLYLIRNGAYSAEIAGYNANVWMHIAGVISDVEAKHYLNGVLLNTGAGVGVGVTSNTAGRTINIAAVSGAGTGMTGIVDNVRVWDRSLRDREVARLYTEPSAGILVPRRRIISAAAGGAFKPYWASQHSRIIGAGVH